MQNTREKSCKFVCNIKGCPLKLQCSKNTDHAHAKELACEKGAGRSTPRSGVYIANSSTTYDIWDIITS